MKKMAYKAVDTLFIVVYGHMNPTDEEWYGYMGAVRQRGMDKTVQLNVTEGGGPNSSQRKYLNDLLNGRTVPVSVLSGSVTVRGITTALGWFNRGIKVFQPSELPAALEHLGIPEHQVNLISRYISDLRGELRQPQLACG
jgi:hypothetical protein